MCNYSALVSNQDFCGKKQNKKVSGTSSSITIWQDDFINKTTFQLRGMFEFEIEMRLLWHTENTLKRHRIHIKTTLKRIVKWIMRMFWYVATRWSC